MPLRATRVALAVCAFATATAVCAVANAGAAPTPAAGAGSSGDDRLATVDTQPDATNVSAHYPQATATPARDELVRADRDLGRPQLQIVDPSQLTTDGGQDRVTPPPPSPAATAEPVPTPAPPPPPAPKWVRPNAGRLTSPFGPRWGGFHSGIDLGGGYGSPILAATDGVVTYAGPESGYGRIVKIDDSDGTQTWYGHMERYLVKTGDHVKAGQEIALVGSAGDATGPHLHFEVHVGGKPVDPVPFLAARGVHI